MPARPGTGEPPQEVRTGIRHRDFLSNRDAGDAVGPALPGRELLNLVAQDLLEYQARLGDSIHGPGPRIRSDTSRQQQGKSEDDTTGAREIASSVHSPMASSQ